MYFERLTIFSIYKTQPYYYLIRGIMGYGIRDRNLLFWRGLYTTNNETASTYFREFTRGIRHFTLEFWPVVYSIPTSPADFVCWRAKHLFSAIFNTNHPCHNAICYPASHVIRDVVGLFIFDNLAVGVHQLRFQLHCHRRPSSPLRLPLRNMP